MSIFENLVSKSVCFFNSLNQDCWRFFPHLHLKSRKTYLINMEFEEVETKSKKKSKK